MPNYVQGRVKSRSSKPGGSTGPPGEAEVLALNPQREQLILQRTGWVRLEPGTLNVEAPEDEIEALLNGVEPQFVEPGDGVVYPAKYDHIPRKRKAYRYFRATIRVHDAAVDVLIRRAEVPVKGRLEVLSSERLRDRLVLSDDHEVVIEIDETQE